MLKTISDLFEHAWQGHWDSTRFNKSRWALEVRKYYERHIAKELGPLAIALVTPALVKRWHRGMVTTPTSANRCLEILSKAFSFAEEEDLLPPGSNPCRFVKANREKKRSRYASAAELERIGAVLQQKYITHPVQVTFVLAIALTGARPISLQRALRSEMHVDEDVTYLRFHGKTTEATGQEEVIILPPIIVDMIGKLLRRPDGLIFGPVDYRSLWHTVQREAKCPDLWLRDFRRTYASFGLSIGIGIDSIGELLNHLSMETTKRYAKLLPVRRVEAAHSISEKIGNLIGVKA